MKTLFSGSLVRNIQQLTVARPRGTGAGPRGTGHGKIPRENRITVMDVAEILALYLDRIDVFSS